MKKIKAYLGGNMTNEGAKLLRLKEQEKLKGVEGLQLYNPVTNDEINDKTKKPTAEDIFEQDTKAILESDVLIFDATGTPGTTAEIGIAWGVNYVLTLIMDALIKAEEAASKADKEEAPEVFVDTVLFGIVNIFKSIPLKKVYWQNSDIRNVPVTETGLRRSYGFNAYLLGLLLDLAGEDKTFDEIVESLKKDVPKMIKEKEEDR